MPTNYMTSIFTQNDVHLIISSNILRTAMLILWYVYLPSSLLHFNLIYFYFHFIMMILIFFWCSASKIVHTCIMTAGIHTLHIQYIILNTKSNKELQLISFSIENIWRAYKRDCTQRYIVFPYPRLNK